MPVIRVRGVVPPEFNGGRAEIRAGLFPRTMGRERIRVSITSPRGKAFRKSVRDFACLLNKINRRENDRRCHGGYIFPPGMAACFFATDFAGKPPRRDFTVNIAGSSASCEVSAQRDIAGIDCSPAE